MPLNQNLTMMIALLALVAGCEEAPTATARQGCRARLSENRYRAARLAFCDGPCFWRLIGQHYDRHRRRITRT